MVWKNESEIEKVEKIGKLSPTEYPDNSRIKESNDFGEKHKTILERVKYILKCDKLARKDYLWLMLLYYVKCNMIKIIVPLEDFSKKTSPTSIDRARRHLYRMARKGNKELKWLLSDEEFLEDQEVREELFREFYAEEKFKEKARIIK